MRIGLIPQVRINSLMPRQSVPYVPLGLLCLAGAVDRNAHEIEIIDLTLLVSEGRLGFDADFEKRSAELICSRGFDLVGFSTFSAGFHHTLKIASNLKELSPSTRVVFGGPQATFCDKDVIRHFPVDVVVRGEAETSFNALLEALASGADLATVKGITYRKDSEIVRNADQELVEQLDDLPLPAFDLYPVKGHPKMPIEASRGCPFKCTYCVTSRYWGRTIRNKSPKRIHDEMSLLKKRYNVKLISFADDTFTINRKSSVELCRYLIKKGAPLKWFCSTRIDSVNDALLKLMSDAGCSSIFYGIESGSPKIQEQIRKNIALDTVVENVRLTSKHGIGVTASFIMGFPDETEDDLKLTLNLRNELKRLFSKPQTIQLHVLAPDINTEITLDNLDRLDYDGFHSDQAGGSQTWSDKDMILKHKDLFLPYYYIRMSHLERDLIKQMHYYIFASELVAYWTTLYINLKDGDPLRLFSKWNEFHRGFNPPRDMPKNASPDMFATVSFLSFLNMEVMTDEKIPYPVMELFRHEVELMSLKGMIVIDPEMKRRADKKEDLDVKSYDFDPDTVVEALRRDLLSVEKLKESSIELAYYQGGTAEGIPQIRYKKR